MPSTSSAPAADVVLTDEESVTALVAELELDVKGLIDAVRYADSERALCTANDVHGFSSMTVYDKTARALRETYVGRGWERDETNNQAGIAHPVKKIRLVPCNFDQNTCNPLVQPSNRSPKGEVSKAKTRCNATAWLPGLPDIPAQSEHEYKTWILGVYAVDGEPLKAELCFPVEFDGKHFTRFSIRAMLLRGDEESETPARRSGDAPPPTEIVDIPIARK